MDEIDVNYFNDSARKERVKRKEKQAYVYSFHASGAGEHDVDEEHCAKVYRGRYSGQGFLCWNVFYCLILPAFSKAQKMFWLAKNYETVY